ncbi:Hypothetical_protein [Hexamita inflata]|uniref:Hypothetical_protein n=1 Tax=Hexamita inflata TaxID=28002 RepID=A0AA86NVY8_9EUKA|nr:Hypothetical protein HINF_LOCUS14623 [Hexamita inflata]
MLFMKLFLQTEVDCFSSSSVSLSYQTLFGISLQYAQNCIPNLVSPNIYIDVRIMRPNMLISCSYDNLNLSANFELVCQCEQNDSVCESFRHKLNDNPTGFDRNQFFQQELSSFTVEIKVLVTENDLKFSQNIYFNLMNEGNQLFMIFVAVLMIIALILLVFLLVHIFKCTQKRIKGRNDAVLNQTPCPSTVACTKFDSETIKNTIL